MWLSYTKTLDIGRLSNALCNLNISSLYTGGTKSDWQLLLMRRDTWLMVWSINEGRHLVDGMILLCTTRLGVSCVWAQWWCEPKLLGSILGTWQIAKCWIVAQKELAGKVRARRPFGEHAWTAMGRLCVKVWLEQLMETAMEMRALLGAHWRTWTCV